MSPLVCDLGHIANFENQWIATATATAPGTDLRDRDHLFEATAHARADRLKLDLPNATQAREQLQKTREDSRRRLRAPGENAPARLLDDGLVLEMLAQHEAQHGETMLQSIGLIDGFAWPRPLQDPSTEERSPALGMTVIPAGAYSIGATTGGFTYDNESPRHTREVASFAIALAPVTNREFLGFVEAGGYQRPEFWSRAGDSWREKARVEAPLGWQQINGEWHTTTMGHHRRLPDHEAVIHVSCFEAEAYAKFRGKRLPTEFEWEVAASADLETEEPAAASLAANR